MLKDLNRLHAHKGNNQNYLRSQVGTSNNRKIEVTNCDLKPVRIIDNKAVYHFGASLKDLGKNGSPSLKWISEQS